MVFSCISATSLGILDFAASRKGEPTQTKVYMLEVSFAFPVKNTNDYGFWPYVMRCPASMAVYPYDDMRA